MLAAVALYLCALLQFVRFYVQNTVFYLRMPAYLSGHERLPFQERILPAVLICAIEHIPLVTSEFHSSGAFTAQLGPFYLLSLLSLLIASVYTQKLYSSFTSSGALQFLVLPTFLFCVMWTYCIHNEANYSYPYDLPSVAFFAAGLFYIARKNFLALFLVILIGTFNRETTLFLIALYVLDAASSSEEQTSSLRERFDFTRVSIMRTGLLCLTWSIVHFGLVHLFAGNDNSENFLRVHNNLLELRPRLLPALLNVCGYTIPLVVVFQKGLRPLRLRNYLFVLPVWFAIMFGTGVLIETRIYGELCSFSSVALVLIFENYLQTVIQPSSLVEEALTRSIRSSPAGVVPVA